MTRQRHATLGAILGLALCLSLSCRRIPRSSTAPALPRSTWWNFYARGIEFSRRNEWDSAIRDLETAMGKRKGAIFPENTEKRRAKTYGLHFLDNYFPHRELGVCLYYQGRLSEAEAELLVSLKMLPSSRASFYLNRVRQARLRKQQTDVRPGRIRLDFAVPEGTVFTNKAYVDLDGKATSPDYVSSVTANGHPLFIELARRSVEIKHRTVLSPGQQEVLVTAQDLAGNQATWSRSVVVDLAGPSISVAKDPTAPKQNILLTVSDEVGLMAVTINGRRVVLPPDSLTMTRAVPVTGRREIVVTAIDRAGNKTNWRRRTGDLLKASLDPRQCHPTRQLAMAPVSTMPLFMTAEASGAASTKGVKRPDSAPPRLQLFPDLADGCTVTTEHYVLDLEVQDEGMIDSVSIKMGAWHEQQSLRSAQCMIHRVTHTLALAPGDNTIRIQVTDLDGNVRTREATITRKVNCLWREDLRMTVEFLPIQKDHVPAMQTVDLAGPILEKLVESPRRLNVVDRSPRVLERLLLELKLSQTPLADYRAAVSAGRLKAADWLLRGRLFSWAGKDNSELLVELVDVATSEVVVITDIHFVGNEEHHVRHQALGLVGKLHQLLPRVSTPISRVSRKSVALSLGTRDQIAPGMEFLFIPGDHAEPEFADPKTSQKRWIHGRVTTVKDRSCALEILPPEGQKALRKGDIAVLR